ncbi:MAG: hypothetical protein OXC44_04085 [Proteobacteria bacterium]|nr:hypothetical protein [Pseudomonadota bacterium]
MVYQFLKVPSFVIAFVSIILMIGACSSANVTEESLLHGSRGNNLEALEEKRRADEALTELYSEGYGLSIVRNDLKGEMEFRMCWATSREYGYGGVVDSKGCGNPFVLLNEDGSQQKPLILTKVPQAGILGSLARYLLEDPLKGNDERLHNALLEEGLIVSFFDVREMRIYHRRLVDNDITLNDIYVSNDVSYYYSGAKIKYFGDKVSFQSRVDVVLDNLRKLMVKMLDMDDRNMDYCYPLPILYLPNPTEVVHDFYWARCAIGGLRKWHDYNVKFESK